MPKYHSVSVMYEYSDEHSEQRKINRAVMTVYGESEFAIQTELERQYPRQQAITILSVEMP